ncbi:hypothetical protein AMECASPLE_020932 [Ameca splendens]|uniref:Secreted protein n=1 Tax=Ameca splendens TaxID=208324 RepID=A0ABV1A098_9TELE
MVEFMMDSIKKELSSLVVAVWLVYDSIVVHQQCNNPNTVRCTRLVFPENVRKVTPKRGVTTWTLTLDSLEVFSLVNLALLRRIRSVSGQTHLTDQHKQERAQQTSGCSTYFSDWLQAAMTCSNRSTCICKAA